MGRGERVDKNRGQRRSGGAETLRPPSIIIKGLITVLLATCLVPQQAEGDPDLILTDLWDSPYRLSGICNERATVLFVCDTQSSVCREGAVFFDARADEIEAEGFRAIVVMIGPPAEARAFVLKTGIDQPVYVDSDRRIFGTLLDQEVLPALVLVDGEGRHVRSLYGGGESLESNIVVMLQEGAGDNRRWWLVLIPIAVIAILPFLLG